MLDFGFYNMDCMEGMKEFPDNYFDLAVVDPPYGIGESGATNKNRGVLYKATDYKPFYGGDKESAPKEYFDALFRISKNQIIFGANHFISKIPIDSHCWIVWDKQNGDNYFADCELAWTSFGASVKKFTFKWQGMLQGDMKNKEARIHPTQKPIALYTWILNKFAKPGDKILDTHVGSASNLIACHRKGLDFVGFELDKGYFKKASEWLEAEKAQVMFGDYDYYTKKELEG